MFILLSENRKLGNQIKALEMHLMGRDVLRFCQQAMERVKLIKIFVGKGFHLEPKCKLLNFFKLLNTRLTTLRAESPSVFLDNPFCRSKETLLAGFRLTALL